MKGFIPKHCIYQKKNYIYPVFNMSQNNRFVKKKKRLNILKIWFISECYNNTVFFSEQVTNV